MATLPGRQETKVPAMRGWPGLNQAEWDCADLAAAVDEYQPAVAYCCCLAVQPEIVAVDIDITNPQHADTAAKLADDQLGKTPLLRIGFAPKCVRIFATAAAHGRASFTRSNCTQAPGRSSALDGIRKLAGHISGRTPHRWI